MSAMKYIFIASSKHFWKTVILCILLVCIFTAYHLDSLLESSLLKKSDKPYVVEGKPLFSVAQMSVFQSLLRDALDDSGLAGDINYIVVYDLRTSSSYIISKPILYEAINPITTVSIVRLAHTYTDVWDTHSAISKLSTYYKTKDKFSKDLSSREVMLFKQSVVRPIQNNSHVYGFIAYFGDKLYLQQESINTLNTIISQDIIHFVDGNNEI